MTPPYISACWLRGAEEQHLVRYPGRLRAHVWKCLSLSSSPLCLVSRGLSVVDGFLLLPFFNLKSFHISDIRLILQLLLMGFNENDNKTQEIKYIYIYIIKTTKKQQQQKTKTKTCFYSDGIHDQWAKAHTCSLCRDETIASCNQRRLRRCYVFLLTLLNTELSRC